MNNNFKALLFGMISSMSVQERAELRSFVESMTRQGFKTLLRVPRIVKDDLNVEDLTRIGLGMIKHLFLTPAPNPASLKTDRSLPLLPEKSKIAYLGAPPVEFVVPVAQAVLEWQALSSPDRLKLIRAADSLITHATSVQEFESLVDQILESSRLIYSGRPSIAPVPMMGELDSITYFNEDAEASDRHMIGSASSVDHAVNDFPERSKRACFIDYEGGSSSDDTSSIRVDDTAHQHAIAVAMNRNQVQNWYDSGKELTDLSSDPDLTLSNFMGGSGVSSAVKKDRTLAIRNPLRMPRLDSVVVDSEKVPSGKTEDKIDPTHAPVFSDVHSSLFEVADLVFGSPVAAAFFAMARCLTRANSPDVKKHSRGKLPSYNGWAQIALGLIGMIPDVVSLVRSRTEKACDSDFVAQVKAYRTAKDREGTIQWKSDSWFDGSDAAEKRPMAVWWVDWIEPLCDALSAATGQDFTSGKQMDQLTILDFEQGKRISDNIIYKMKQNSGLPGIGGLLNRYAQVMDKSANVLDDDYFQRPYIGSAAYSGAAGQGGSMAQSLMALLGTSAKTANQLTAKPTKNTFVISPSSGTKPTLSPTVSAPKAGDPFSALTTLLNPTAETTISEAPTDATAHPQSTADLQKALLEGASEGGSMIISPASSTPEDSSSVLLRYYVGGVDFDDYYTGGLFKKIKKFSNKVKNGVGGVVNKAKGVISKAAAAVGDSKLIGIASVIPGPIGTIASTAKKAASIAASLTSKVPKLVEDMAKEEEETGNTPLTNGDEMAYVPEWLQKSRIRHQALSNELKGELDPSKRMATLLAFSSEYPDHLIAQALERKKEVLQIIKRS